MKYVYLLVFILLLQGCSSISLGVKSCNTSAIWASSFEQTRHLDARALNDNAIMINYEKTYFVPFYKKIELVQILSENNLNCADVKTLRVVIDSKYMVFKKVKVFVTI